VWYGAGLRVVVIERLRGTGVGTHDLAELVRTSPNLAPSPAPSLSGGRGGTAFGDPRFLSLTRLAVIEIGVDTLEANTRTCRLRLLGVRRGAEAGDLIVSHPGRVQS